MSKRAEKVVSSRSVNKKSQEKRTHVKGNETNPRWLVETELNSSVPQLIKGRVILIAEFTAFLARDIARIYFMQQTGNLGLCEKISVTPFRANGHLPSRVTVVSRVSCFGDLAEEHFNFRSTEGNDHE